MSWRKVLGAWYTPEALVDHVVSVALEGRRWSARRFRVLDPACGDGRFLAEVARRVASLDVSAELELVGVDVDEQAVAAVCAAVPSATIVHADALARDGGHERFDLVIGPAVPEPVGRRHHAWAGARASVGGPGHAAAEFLALAVGLATPRWSSGVGVAPVVARGA